MKIKALKDFQSVLFDMIKGEIKEVELDAYTLKNWVENGLIEVFKQAKNKSVSTDETK